MSDWFVIRIPFDNPNKIEITEVLPNVPLDWQKYLEKVAKTTKKQGRYLVANILYQAGEAFYPEDKKNGYLVTEKESGD